MDTESARLAVVYPWSSPRLSTHPYGVVRVDGKGPVIVTNFSISRQRRAQKIATWLTLDEG